jgi:anhydro-N-acetylmuramic acid kinase
MAERAAGERYVGLISGTSMDGIDAVLVDFSGGQPSLVAALTHPFDGELRAALDAVRRDPDRFPVSDLGRLDAVMGDRLADAALAVVEAAGCSPGDVRAIGSHGQTIVHHAEADPPFTLQIGDPWRLARRSAMTTVADFRRADLAAGGQGAPLAPLLHDALFRDDAETRCVVNLGGIANATLLEPGRDVLGSDTGPANCLLDLWYRRHHAEGRYDAGGQWAASGRVDRDWLAELMRDPYLARPAPKSTGIEYYTPAWLDERLPEPLTMHPADVQATLAEFSAASLADALEALDSAHIDRLLVCGGGVHNDDLLERLRRRLPETPIESTADHGLDPDHVEATLFAWLARRRLAGERVDTRSITGASNPVLAGSVAEA